MEVEQTKNTNLLEQAPEVQLNELASYIFLKHNTEEPVHLNIHGIQGCKDLFIFCFELLCKGFVLMYGDNDELDIETLTEEQIESACKKLHVAGIFPEITYISYDNVKEGDVVPYGKIVASRDANPENKPDTVEAYYAFMYTSVVAAMVRFQIKYNVSE